MLSLEAMEQKRLVCGECLHLNLLNEIIRKVVDSVVVDDSIVRGTTLESIIKMLRVST